MIKLGYGVILALCGAILVHIAIIFLIPRLSAPSITTRLQTQNASKDPLIFVGHNDQMTPKGTDPFFRYRICFYNLDEGVFQLVSTGEVPFFSASLVAVNGDVLFSITDRQTINRTLNLEVRNFASKQSLSQASVEVSSVDGSVPVYVAAPKGYAVIRAFVPDSSWDQIADNFLKSVICQSVEAAE